MGAAWGSDAFLALASPVPWELAVFATMPSLTLILWRCSRRTGFCRAGDSDDGGGAEAAAQKLAPLGKTSGRQALR
jgi:hypothetical protein